ncbi:hypothetical protein DFH07DRAFT_762417 [Mycena maculata]|uniref:Macrofage activating glycoprotein n=1 Tax=Mycena maculata TaxID=230809 RepID=A0AAD7HBB7_9AGAR|nr:hypothetical protein DFH07DRAFT_762417 [Mycena maculata]
MSPAAPSSAFSRFALLLSTAALLGVNAQQGTYPATPLASKHFAYPSGIPYQADTDGDLVRGPQFGYNECNSTTEGQTSDCQTSFLNSLDDFCLWAPAVPNSTIADTEGEEVAWCTKPGRGTRLIPAGALQGVQFMKTPDYVQVVGFIDQTQINMQPGDSGGELGALFVDLRGNPLGALVYSTAWSESNNSYTQVIEWHNFMGGGAFCFKACDPAGANASNFCQHIYDRIGCAYNAPNAAQNGSFTSCEGDDQDFPGIYTANGTVMTYSQPPESRGVISSLPYQPRVPASSNCVTFTSAALYAAMGTPAASATSVPVTSGGATAGATAGPGGPTKSGGIVAFASASASATGTGTSSGAGALRVSAVSAVVGVVVAVVLLS